MLCYAMLRYATLCYAMLRYATVCYAMLCYAKLCYAMLCYAMLCYAMLCYAMLTSIIIAKHRTSRVCWACNFSHIAKIHVAPSAAYSRTQTEQERLCFLSNCRPVSTPNNFIQNSTLSSIILYWPVDYFSSMDISTIIIYESIAITLFAIDLIYNFFSSKTILADIKRWINVGLTLVPRQRRWTNVEPTLIQRYVSAGCTVLKMKIDVAKSLARNQTSTLKFQQAYLVSVHGWLGSSHQAHFSNHSPATASQSPVGLVPETDWICGGGDISLGPGLNGLV